MVRVAVPTTGPGDLAEQLTKDPRDDAVMLGPPMRRFLRELTGADAGRRIHFVTAREMVNVILAACDGRDGLPGDYRDCRLRPNRPDGAAASPRAHDGLPSGPGAGQ